MHRLRKKLGHLAFAMHRRLEVLDLKRLCERTLIGVRCSEAAGWVNAFDPQCKVSSQAKVENDIKVDEYLIYLWNILKMNSYIYHIYISFKSQRVENGPSLAVREQPSLASRPCQSTMWHESLRSPTSILATGTGWVWYPIGSMYAIYGNMDPINISPLC